MPPKKKITDKAYDKALANNLPSKWVSIAFKYFSQSTTDENMKPSKILAAVLFSLFGIGFIGTILNLNKSIIGPAIIGYSIILTSLVVFLFAAVFMNNYRLNKIVKELGVSKRQYNSYITIRNAKNK